MFVFFFKQKTAYEMRISDWSSDVCSSDLFPRLFRAGPGRLPADVNHRRASFIHGEGRVRGGGWIVQMLAAIGKTVRRHIQHAHALGRIDADDPLTAPARRSRQLTATDQRPRFGLFPVRQLKTRFLHTDPRYPYMTSTFTTLQAKCVGKG